MWAGEVVAHEMQRDGVHVVLKLLGEPIREAGEAAHGHSHREVLPLHVARADVGGVRCPDNHALFRADAHRWTIAPLRFLCVWTTVDFDEHGIVDLTAERALYGL